MKSNPYDPNYIMRRDNCSYEEAVDFIKKYKDNKATSLINFIKKYGEELGNKKYNDWIDSSLKTGWQAAAINGKSQSKFSKDYYIRKGYSIDDSIAMAIDYQHNNSPLHIEYYISRGKNLEYARSHIRKIHDKKLGRDCYREFLRSNTSLSDEEISESIRKLRGHCTRENLGDVEFDKRLLITRQTFESKKIWVPLDDLSDYELYRREVFKYTNMNDLTVLENFDKRARAGIEGGYNLDHNYSISQGYINGISPELIGSIKNLRMIPWKENVVKQGKCEITIEELSNEN